MEWVKSWYFKKIALVLAITMLAVGSVPAKSMAYVVGAEEIAPSRGADMDAVQRVLESKLVAEKLKSAGLTMEEIQSRLDKLTDEELHQFASQLESLQPGGDALGVVIGLLVIVILVIVILKLTDKKIVIK